jgi:acyl-CoA synthetase (NDP forming)
MDNSVKRALDRLFYPRTVAVFGSVREGKIAHQIVTQMVRVGFTGRLVVVNPKAEGPEGFAQVPALAKAGQVEGGLDLAVLALPAQFAEEALREAGEAGAAVAVVITAGYSEAGNLEAERRLAAAAREAGVRLIGPNCAGIMNTANHLSASIEPRALPGRVAFITQSGAVGGAVLGLAGTRGIGFSKFVSYGNRADLGEEELLEYLAADPETAVIALYLESVADGRRLLPVLAAAAAAKPVIAVKAGRTATGKRAASSHTGSLAGADEVFAAAFRRAGVVRAAGIEELLDLCDAFAHLPAPAGRRVAIVTNSGGPGILAADRAEELGLQVAEPPAQVRDSLRSFLSERCAVGNPVDLTVEGTGANYERTLRLLLEGGYDAAIAIDVSTPFLDTLGIARGVLAARDALGAGGGAAPAGGAPGRSNAVRPARKPIAAVFAAGEVVAEAVRLLQASGMPCFPSGERAALALLRLREREELLAARERAARERAVREGPSGLLPEPRRLPWPSARPSGPPAELRGGLVPEPEGWAFLQGLGLPFPAHRFCRSQREAAEAAAALSAPQVLKVVSSQVAHKSDRGGVVLDLADAASVERAYADLAERFAGVSFQGALLAEQVAGGLEVIIGLKRDPVFGPVVLAGMGGVWTELLHDAAVRLAPVDELEALEMLEGLKSAPLLAGFRGSPARDRQALAALIARVSLLALEFPEIAELDLNPVLLLPERRGVRIADVRLLRV